MQGAAWNLRIQHSSRKENTNFSRQVVVTRQKTSSERQLCLNTQMKEPNRTSSLGEDLEVKWHSYL